jgi:outer membrane translocation and assembly module TamA
VTDDLYADIGVGLRIGFPRSSSGGILRFDIAVPLRDGDDGTRSFEPRFLVSAGQLFSARLRSEAAGSEKSNVEVGLDR